MYNILIDSSRTRSVLDKGCKENQNTPFMFNKFLPKIILWENMVEPDKPQMTL